MKILPCRAACNGAPALTSKNGPPHTAGMLSAPAITYICKRCGQPTRLLAIEFKHLPEAT